MDGPETAAKLWRVSGSEGEEGVHKRMRREMDAELWMDLELQPGGGGQDEEGGRHTEGEWRGRGREGEGET